MKNSKNDDSIVINELRKQARAETDYNEKFLAQRRVAAKAQKERETKFEKFKRFQDKERTANDMLMEFLAKKS